MARFKPYNYDQLVMLPISLEDQLEPGTLEYTINELVENHIDLSVFEGRYHNDDTGATAFNPKVLLKVILLIDEMKAKIDTPEGKRIYAKRLAIVEPVFANIRVQKRLDHFTVRTKAKVDIQWRLFALVHNIGKIHNYGLVS
jgi:hypothetical protein